MSQEPPRRQSAFGRMLLLCAFVVPVAGFVLAMALWTGRFGLPNEGRGAAAGLAVIAGVGLIVGVYLLADRYWIRRRD